MTDGTNTYNWNARNQLASISGGSTSSFVYDGLGRRQRKTVGGAAREFLYDGVNPVQETSGATVLANILGGLGIDEVFTRTDVPATVTSHFLPDGLRSAVALTDPAGAVQTEYTYEPFGRTTATLEPNTNPFQFTGRENDGTGLYFYRARYYHPVFQRFISEDQLNPATVQLPMTDLPPTLAYTVKSLSGSQSGMTNPLLDLNCEPGQQSGPNVKSLSALLSEGSARLHPFVYVKNNPLGFVDPLGHSVACAVCVGITRFWRNICARGNLVACLSCFAVRALVCVFCGDPPEPPDDPGDQGRRK